MRGCWLALAAPLVAIAADPLPPNDSPQGQLIELSPEVQRKVEQYTATPPHRPIRKLTMETTSSARFGGSKPMVRICSFDRGEHGLLARNCQGSSDDTSKRAAMAIELVFAGYTPTLAMAGGFSGQSIVTTYASYRGWSFSGYRTTYYDMQSGTTLLTWDADLQAIANPRLGAEWKETFEIQATMGGTNAGKTIDKKTVTKKTTRSCKVIQSRPASSIHPSLEGEALDVECIGEGEGSASQRQAFLVDSGIYVPQWMKLGSTETTSRILDVEFE